MTTIDEEKLEIQISETLSFSYDVQPRIEEVIENIEDRLKEGEYEESKEDVRRFLQYTMTQEDKVKILRNIVEDYEQELYRSDCVVTIFDEDGILRGINQWIEEKFDFSWI